MKVMCTRPNTWYNYNGTKSEDKDPVFGEICEVTGFKKVDNNLYYYLTGYTSFYNSKGFIPLSDIDETELAKQRGEYEPA